MKEGQEGTGPLPRSLTHTTKTCTGSFTQTLPGELRSWEGISERGFKGNEEGEQH